MYVKKRKKKKKDRRFSPVNNINHDASANGEKNTLSLSRELLQLKNLF